MRSSGWIFGAAFGCAVMAGSACAQQAAQNDLSARMSDSVRSMWPAGVVSTENKPGVWSYEEGVLLDGLLKQWHARADGRDFAYVKAAVDKYVQPDGSIRTFGVQSHSLDEIEMGRAVLEMYRVTRQPKYYQAAKKVHDELMTQPRTASGGFWHKEIYPNQMWLDGAYMAGPFLAEYATTFQQPKDLDEVVNQLLLMDAHMRDLNTGLLRHGWDESREMPWADKATGLSPEIWARADGWYVVALVDVLDCVPMGYPRRGELLESLNKTMAAAVHYQDKDTGLWWQVMDKGGQPGNFLEASASSMFTYALAKGVRRQYLPESYLHQATSAWQGLGKQFVKDAPDGGVRFTGTVKTGGLGGNPYRSGTFDYYVHERVIDNDAKGVGAFLMAGAEMLQATTSVAGHGRTAMVDAWFNSQTRNNAAGQSELFHYKWDDEADSGFSFFGDALARYGMQLTEAKVAPTAAVLRGADLYVIASPDTIAKNPQAHTMDKASGDAIQAWVQAGGVLLLMMNDAANTEFEGMNTLSDRFGIHFNPVVRNKVTGENYEQGKVVIPGSTAIFANPHTTFMKDTCTMTLTKLANPVLKKDGDVLMAVSVVGQGTVIAVADPWLYNEYTDGRKLPAAYDTYAAAVEFSGWMLRQMH